MSKKEKHKNKEKLPKEAEIEKNDVEKNENVEVNDIQEQNIVKNEEITDNNTKKKAYKKTKCKTKKTKITKIIFSAILVITVLLLIIFIVIPRMSKNKTVITIGDTSYTKADYMIYLKITKDAYFSKEIDEIPDATLRTIVSQENNLTLQQYLRLRTEENLKIAGVIEKMAQDNKITLSEETLKEMAQAKQTKIDKLGGEAEFQKWLYKNQTTEEAYDKMLKTETLYNQIYKSLYSAGNKNDLTQEEKDAINKTYTTTYTKIRQVILLTVNPLTTEKITETEKQQKKLLVDTIRAEITAENFDEQIKKYSDNAVNVEPPYSVYFTEGQLLEIIETTAKNLQVGQISEVVESEYAYHIIIRDALDDEYIENLYEKARDKKLLNDISTQIADTAIIIENSLEKIKIK